MIRILFFGKLADFSPAISCDLPRDVTTSLQLAAWLGENNPALAEALSQKGNRVAVNQIMASQDSLLEDGDEIAFMSPLSGG